MDNLIKELIEIFTNLKIPFKHKNTDEKLKVPFVVYSRQKDEEFFSDNKRFLIIPTVNVEIYFFSLKNQLSLEKKFESALEEKGLIYSKSEEIEINKDVNLIYYDIQGGIRNGRN